MFMFLSWRHGNAEKNDMSSLCSLHISPPSPSLNVRPLFDFFFFPANCHTRRTSAVGCGLQRLRFRGRSNDHTCRIPAGGWEGLLNLGTAGKSWRTGFLRFRVNSIPPLLPNIAFLHPSTRLYSSPRTHEAHQRSPWGTLLKGAQNE